MAQRAAELRLAPVAGTVLVRLPAQLKLAGLKLRALSCT